MSTILAAVGSCYVVNEFPGLDKISQPFTLVSNKIAKIKSSSTLFVRYPN